jgi:hypothetical protein
MDSIWSSFISSISSVFEAMWGWILGHIATLIPSWLLTASSGLMGHIATPTARYFAWLIAFDVLIPVMVGAYLTRYLLRRVP